MGIKGLWDELGKQDRVPLAKLSVEHFHKHKRHIRVAIDFAIWSFQSQAVKGRNGVGSNAAIRVLYYRLCELLHLNIHAVFVFDGKDRPDFKRDKVVYKNEGYQVALARRLIKGFGFPIHNAPGEAEAECAYLQKEGIVDAVLSEDVDTLMFGCRQLWRSGSDKGDSKSVKTLLVYQSRVIRDQVKLTPQGMILAALLSGGDYDSTGVANLGIKVAVAAAKAGYGEDLIKACQLEGQEREKALGEWRERLQKSIRTNCERIFSRKQTNATIPADFPDPVILEYYTNPKISETRPNISWDIRPDIDALREFTSLKFEWTGSGKLIRTLSEKLLSWQLGHNASGAKDRVLDIHQRRSGMRFGMPDEIRITYRPIEVVNLPYDHEKDNVYVKSNTTVDAEVLLEDERGYSDSDNEDIRVNGVATTVAVAGRLDRPKVEYDPRNTRRVWVYEDFLNIGAGSNLRLWEMEETKKRVEKERTAQDKQKRTEAKGLRTKNSSAATTTNINQRTLNGFLSQTKRPMVVNAKPLTSSKEVIDLEAPNRKENTNLAKPVIDLRSRGSSSLQHLRTAKPALVADRKPLKSMKVVTRESLPGAWKSVSEEDMDKYDDKSLDDVGVWDLTDVQ